MRFVRVLFAMTALAPPCTVLAAPCAGFTDVDDSSAFCVNVAWMKNRGITLGVTATQYAPNDPVSRLQMAAFMYRLGFQNAFLQGGNAFGATAQLGTTDSQHVEIRAGGSRVMRLEAVSGNVVGGHSTNLASPGTALSVIAGGGSGGTLCYAPNRPPRPCNNVAGTAQNHNATIGGGASNDATGNVSTVSGGFGNTASGNDSTVVGGIGNLAGGVHSVVVGGRGNTASGQSSLAAGWSANAALPGCFVWADASSTNATSCFGANEFVLRSVGGFYLWTAGFDDGSYSGARLASGTGGWAAYSDSNGKHAISPVDPHLVLEKVVSMPIATWQWKAEPGSVRHMGPMAQDFRAAFGLGERDTEIVTVDADGVALAAIQGLNAKVERRLAARDDEVAALRAELDELRSVRTELAALRAILAERRPPP